MLDKGPLTGLLFVLQPFQFPGFPGKWSPYNNGQRDEDEYAGKTMHLTCMELDPRLPLVHLHRVVSHKEILRLVAQRQSNHVLLLRVIGRDVAPRALQSQRWGGCHVPSKSCTNKAQCQ